MYISKPVILRYNTVSYLYYTIFTKFATLLKPAALFIVFQQCIIAIEFNDACLAMQLLLCFSFGQVSISQYNLTFYTYLKFSNVT